MLTPYRWYYILWPQRIRTQSAGRPVVGSRGGGTGKRVGRGGKGRGPREGNDEHVDELNGQGNDREKVGNVLVNGNRVGCSYKEFLACNPKEYDGKRGVVVLTRWIEKMESMQDMSGCSIDQKVKYTVGLFVGKALTWWNSQIRMLSPKVAVIGAGHAAYTNRFHELARLVPHLVTLESRKIKRYLYGLALQICGMVVATEPNTIQKAVQISGALTDEAVRNGSIKKVKKRGNVGEPSKDNNGRDDNKWTRTGNAFSTTASPVGRENTHARTALLMEREARMSREAWGRSMDASDLVRSEVMSLLTTVFGQHAVITKLQAAELILGLFGGFRISKVELGFLGKENRLQILQSIDQGPFELGTTRDALGTTPEGGVLHGPERPRTYEDLCDTEKKRYDVDVRATNIVLQGLPKDIYKLINHNIEAKAIWDNVKMLLAGSDFTKEDRESQLYDEFKRFKMLPGENINEYYVRFHKLVNDMRNIRITMPNIQLNSKFVNNMSPEWDKFVTAVKLNKGLKETNHEQLYAYLKQHD
ncbi:hypothetical protein Tco_0948702 [Tanacetum coccineum]